MFESTEAKNGHSRSISLSSSSPSGRDSSHACAAVPKPYQPGSIDRHWDHENTHGIARSRSMERDRVRDAGRLPMLSSAISLMTVDSQKKSSKPGVSYTSWR